MARSAAAAHGGDEDEPVAWRARQTHRGAASTGEKGGWRRAPVSPRRRACTTRLGTGRTRTAARDYPPPPVRASALVRVPVGETPPVVVECEPARFDASTRASVKQQGAGPCGRFLQESAGSPVRISSLERPLDPYRTTPPHWPRRSAWSDPDTGGDPPIRTGAVQHRGCVASPQKAMHHCDDIRPRPFVHDADDRHRRQC